MSRRVHDFTLLWALSSQKFKGEVRFSSKPWAVVARVSAKKSKSIMVFMFENAWLLSAECRSHEFECKWMERKE